jgi:hypothetical protein
MSRAPKICPWFSPATPATEAILWTSNISHVSSNARARGPSKRRKGRRSFADLGENPALAERISQARSISGEKDISFSVELARAQSVVLKLASGHAAYEASETL